jgi:ketosteroid isomerase-like protein
MHQRIADFPSSSAGQLAFVMLCGLLSALLPGPAAAQDSAAVRQFADRYRTFAEGYRKGEPALVARLYSDSAFYLAPGEPIRRGRGAIDSAFAFLGRPGHPRTIGFDIVDRDVSGDLAYDIGYFRFGPGAPAGKFIVIWKRGADGEWRFWADGYSDVRAAAAGPSAPTAGASPGAEARDSGFARLSPAQLAAVTGRFRMIYPEPPETREIVVTLRGAGLEMNGLSPVAVRLTPLSPTRFRAEGERAPPGATVRFVMAGTRVSAAVLEAAGMPAPMVFVAER